MDPTIIARAAAIVLLAGTVLACSLELARQDLTSASSLPAVDDKMDRLVGELARCKALGAEAAHDAACKAAWAQHRARFLASGAPHHERSSELFPATPDAPQAVRNSHLDRAPASLQPDGSTPGMDAEGR